MNGPGQRRGKKVKPSGWMAGAVTIIGGAVVVPAAIIFAVIAMGNPELLEARKEAMLEPTGNSTDTYLEPPKRIFNPANRTGPDPLPELIDAKLKLSVQELPTYTTISIVGPDELLARAKALSETQSTCPGRHWATSGFSVSWGDGSFAYEQSPDKSFLDSNGCPLPLRHKYSAAGSYEIKVYLWRLLPNYQTKIQWEDTTTISTEATR